MLKDMTIVLEDRPGTLADMGEALGNAGVNIEGIGGISCAGEGTIHILVEDSSKARQVFEKKGMKVAAERDVMVLEIKDQPGVLGKIARKIADAGVNIDLVYITTKSRLVLGVDDIEKARSAL